MTPLQKLPKNVRDLGKLVVDIDFKKLPKVQKIAQSGRTDWMASSTFFGRKEAYKDYILIRNCFGLVSKVEITCKYTLHGGSLV